MSKCNLSDARFIGQTSVGDNTVQNVHQFAPVEEFVAQGELTSEMAQLFNQLLDQLRRSSKVDPSISLTSNEAEDAVKNVAGELTKLPERRDRASLSHGWKRIVETARDFGPIVEVLRSIARLAGLPVP